MQGFSVTNNKPVFNVGQYHNDLSLLVYDKFISYNTDLQLKIEREGYLQIKKLHLLL